MSNQNLQTKQKYTFLESGWFTAGAFALGAFLGLMFGTDFFSLLGKFEGWLVIVPIFSTLAGALLFLELAKLLRKVL